MTEKEKGAKGFFYNPNYDKELIGAGSVVTRDIPAGVIAVGVPCKVLRKIVDEDRYKYKRFEE